MTEPEIITYDLETTGKDPKSDRPVQIGAVYGLHTPRIVMNSFVDPHTRIAPEASDVHGIYAEQVQGHPDYVMGIFMLDLVIEKLEESGPVIVCGFNHIRYDNTMVDTCYPEPIMGPRKHLDILQVIMRYYPELESHKLSKAYQTLLGKPLTGAHGAVEDCLGCVGLLRNILVHQKISLTALHEAMQTPQVYSVMPIGKHKGKRPQDVDPGWARWMKKNANDMHPDLERTVNWILGDR